MDTSVGRNNRYGSKDEKNRGGLGYCQRGINQGDKMDRKWFENWWEFWDVVTFCYFRCSRFTCQDVVSK